jgi:spermidine/putrescine transport system substrate-binding protein
MAETPHVDKDAYVDKKDLEGLIREVAGGRISRRQFFYRAAALGLSTSAIGTVLAACGNSSSSPSASPTPMDTTKPASLYFYNWSDYLAPATRKNFKKQTGINIVETYFDDNEALLAKLKGGAAGYDVICPSDYMVHIMIKSGLLEPLDMSYIPNFSHVDPKFQNPTYDNKTEFGGKKYSVPYQWGTTGIGVRTDKVKETVTSWAVLWDTKYKGQINMDNEERETIGAALKLLGYSLNSTSESEVDQATQKLIEQKPLVNAYDSNNMKRFMLAGTPLVHSWNADALLVMDEIGMDKLAYVLPQEGYTVWVDNLCIPRGAPSPYATHLFMNFLFDPQNAADLVDWVWYLSPVPEAYDIITTKLLKENFPTQAQLANGELMNDVGAFARNYTLAWERVKSA